MSNKFTGAHRSSKHIRIVFIKIAKEACLKIGEWQRRESRLFTQLGTIQDMY